MCEHCPRKSTEEYEELCLEVGYSVDGHGMNDAGIFQLFPFEFKSRFYNSFQILTNATRFLICAVTAAASIHWARIVACATKDIDRIIVELDASVSFSPSICIAGN